MSGLPAGSTRDEKMGKVLLEVCCGSADDVIQAHRAGADRVELNSDLFHGGLTPIQVIG